MDCHKLIYKSSKMGSPYEKYLRKIEEKRSQEKKKQVFGRVIKFLSSRYPRELLDKLEVQINPFELSLQKFKTSLIQKYSQYPQQIVKQSVQYIFTKKYQDSQIIVESAMIIEEGDEDLHNGRKLIKEDFTYGITHFRKDNSLTANLSIDEKSNSKNLTNIKRMQKMQERQSSRSNNSPLRTQKTKSFSRIMEAAVINERFNNIIQDVLDKQKQKYDNMKIIYDDDPDDIINRTPLVPETQRFQKQFPQFKSDDVIHNDEGFDTGRSQLQQLQFLLSINKNPDFSESSRSKNVSRYQLRIKPELLDNLYNVNGGIRFDIVRKAVSQIKNQID